ncbi:hypothetical protein EDD85DRAFT_962989 [Armillaria nabsnona]|nr:hypothetical protein EDD85DRAFT_962989 [Armillaria nabsnona]
MLALATGLCDRFLLKPTLADPAPSIVALMPAISFWLCLFCERIILPSRASEFTFINIHHTVIFILAWITRHKKVTMDPKLFTDYLPFLWFHPPPGCTKYDLNDAWALFTIIDNVTLTCGELLRDLIVHQLEENSTLTAKLIVQFIVDEFAHIPEESDMALLYQSFSAVSSSTVQFACESIPIHTALLKNNILKWICLAFQFVTWRIPFTNVTLLLATRCVGMGLIYIRRVMEDGFSYIHQLLNYDLLLYMFKALRNLHAHPELIDQACKGRKTSMENHTVNVIHMVIFHFIYASILKQSSKAIFKIQRWDVDGFLISAEDLGLQHVCKAWTEFVDIASYQCGILKWILNSSCGNERCLVTSTRWKFMVCSGCQFMPYCSRKCQRDDWSRPSTSHRSLCTKIKQLRADGGPLPISLSDHEAYEKFNIRYVKGCKNQPLEWQELLDKYIAKNGEPDPLWPMILVLEYRTINFGPDIHLESSEQFAEELNLETLAKMGIVLLGR